MEATTPEMETAPGPSVEGTQCGEPYNGRGHLELVQYVRSRISQVLHAHHDAFFRRKLREKEDSIAK